MPQNKAVSEALDALKDAASGVHDLAKIDRASGPLLDILIEDRTLPAAVRLYLELQDIRRGFHNRQRIAALLAAYGRTYDPIPRRRRIRPRSRKGGKLFH